MPASIGREQRDVRQSLRRHRQPGLRLPRDHVAALADRRAEVEQLGRPLRIPAVLVLAHPLDAHRPAHRPRQERGVARRVLGAVLAVGAGAVEVDQPDLLLREAEDPGERLAEAVSRLGRRPDRGAVGADVRDAAGRAEGAVGLDRPPVRRAECLHAGPGRSERRQVALLRDVLVADDRRRADRVGERKVVGQTRARRPLGLERTRGAHRVPLPLGDDAEEAPEPDDPRARNRGDRRLVDRLERRAERRRPDHAPVQHAGEREILDEEVAPRDLRRHVRSRHGLADVAEGVRCLERRLGVDLRARAVGRRSARRRTRPGRRPSGGHAVGDLRGPRRVDRAAGPRGRAAPGEQWRRRAGAPGRRARCRCCHRCRPGRGTRPCHPRSAP